MSLTVELIEFLHSQSGRELLGLELPADELAAQRTLRKHCSGEQAIAVIITRSVRSQAAKQRKFPPDIARELLATEQLLQQASSLAIARHIGRGLREISDKDATAIHDLCCGMGGDTIGLAQAGGDVTVTAADRDEVALRCAAHNASVAGVDERCTFRHADVTALDLGREAVVHIDPDRRGGGRRQVDMSDYLPGVDFLRRLREQTAAGCVKLSPMLPLKQLEVFSPIRAEHIGERGRVRQLVAWWGPELNQPLLSGATVVTGESSESIWAGGAEPAVGPLGEMLIEPDGAVIAASVVDDFAAANGLRRLDPRVVWLTGDSAPDTNLCRGYRVLREVAGRKRDVSRALRDLDGGVVLVKPRGVQINTDRMQKTLRGKGERTLAVFWYRLGSVEKVIIAEPVV